MSAEFTNFESVLLEKFNLPQFRVGQKEIIQAIINKKDVMAVLPTGGGKSLCYQYPAVFLNQLVIVVTPLIALMRDQVMNLSRLGIAAGALHSGQSDSDKREVFQNINKGGAFLLYLSPERVQKEGFQKWIQGRKIALFAIDEAHCVSQWGHDFREEYGMLSILKKLRPDVPVLALTASATPWVLGDIAKTLQLQAPEKRIHGFYRPNLYYQVESCLNDEEKQNLVIQALNQTPEGRVIIYCSARRVTEEVAEFLQKHFTGVGYYHAGMTAVQRTRVQEDYVNNKFRILVATNAFGMGIDQPDVRLVVHYQMPANIDSLYQEMGRAGRDGKHSTCLMLYTKKDKGLQSYFIMSAEAPYAIKDSRYRNLETLVEYSEGSECRHAEILTYYRDAQRITNCGHCDVCDPSSSRRIQRPVDIIEPELILNNTSADFKTHKDNTLSKLVQKSQQAKKEKVSKVSKSTLDKVVLDSTQQERFDNLKAWRRVKANEMDVPAFLVFSDKTLRDLAIKNPQNIESLKKVYGIGEHKLEQFGWDVLAELGVK